MDSNKIADIYDALIGLHYRISNLEDGKKTLMMHTQSSRSSIEKVRESAGEEKQASLTPEELVEIRDGFQAVVADRDKLLKDNRALRKEREALLTFKEVVTATLRISPETHPNHVSQILTSMKNASDTLNKVRAAFK
ncbi:hypothetical protein FCMLKIFP_00092 [Pseudomonas phage Ka3]|nr:hypothetical protein FCMLKIFP_00092 [Pseudomonas phage Ka3]